MALAIQRVFLYYFNNFFQGKEFYKKLSFLEKPFEKSEFARNCEWNKQSYITALKEIRDKIYEVMTNKKTKQSEEIKEKLEKMIALSHAYGFLLNRKAVKFFNLLCIEIAKNLKEEGDLKPILKRIIKKEKIKDIDAIINEINNQCGCNYKGFDDPHFIVDLKFAYDFSFRRNGYFYENLDICRSLVQKTDKVTAYEAITNQIEKIISENKDKVSSKEVFQSVSTTTNYA